MSTKAKTAAGLTGAAAIAFGLYVGGLEYREGVAYRAYQDGVKVWTICMGDTHNVTPGMTATEAECRERDERNARFAWDYVDQVVTTPMTWGQRRAYADYAFNAGVGNFSTSSMLSHANAGRVQESCDAFLEHYWAGKPPNRIDCRTDRRCRGVWDRRQWERKVCLGGDAL